VSKKRKPKEPPTPGATPLTGARLAMAAELAKAGIAALVPDPEIVLGICEKLHTTERSAQALLQRVAREVTELTDPEKDDLRRLLHFRYEFLYQQTVQKGKEEAAARMLDRRAKLAGLYPKDTDAPKEVPVDEFDTRSTEDLHFFRDHGFWPEEKPPENVVPIDPLRRIRKKANG
jgi:hypothetical protein